MDHLQTVNVLQEGCMKYEKALSLTFIDYENAFDSVITAQIVINTSKELGIYIEEYVHYKLEICRLYRFIQWKQ